MVKAILETLYMSYASLVISYLIALPLGTIVVETSKKGLFPHKTINFILNRIIDITRSIPFVILAVFIFPLTRLIVGTAIGTTAMIVPLTICAIPFEARLIEEILSQVPASVVKAAKMDGATKLQIIVQMKWGCKISRLVNSMSISIINIIGYSAMAGIVGGGGLGNYAVVYGFQRFEWGIILKSVIAIIIIVVTIQTINNKIVRKLEKNYL